MTQIRCGYADTPDGQVHYRRVDGPGPPIVLLHRTPVASASFAAMLGFLAGRRAAIALDTPGFGQSFRPPGQPAAADYGRWLLAALDALDIDAFHLAAHHTGTHFATEMAVLAPARALSLTLSGVLHVPPADRPHQRAEMGQVPPLDRAGDYITATWRLMKSLFLHYDAPLVHAETVAALSAREAIDQAFDAIFAQDFAGVLRRVACPVQVVQAADDPLTLTGSLARLRDDFPHITVRQLGPAFLAAPERQPGQFTRALLDFIAPSAFEEPATMPADTDRHFAYTRSAAGYDLVRADRPIPQPGPGEVLLRVQAVSLNRRDLSIRDLSYPVSTDYFTPLSDASGTIVAVGDGVAQWAPGDRVTSTFFQNWASGRPDLPGVFSALGAGGPGVFADHVVLAAQGVAALPDGWSHAQGACLPCAGVTAWSALMTLGHLQPDDHVLVLGTGGVALFAIQIAAAAGARPIVLSSSADKIARAMALGAVHGINYADQPEWAEAVRAYTKGAGVQHVVELGGVGTLAQSVASLGLGGHLAIIGALAGFGGEIQALPMIFSALRASAVMVGSQAEHRALAEFLGEKQVHPVIDSVFAPDAAEAAFARAAQGAFGKVVIAMGDET